MKPILFNTDMVRAILEGRKTVTRRLVRLKYGNTHLEMFTNKYGTRLIEKQNFEPGGTIVKNPDGSTTSKLLACIEKTPPYRPGDILYVREAWAWRKCYDCYACETPNFYKGHMGGFAYKASTTNIHAIWRPSIHMPHEAARLFLRVMDVRMERLQQIMERGPLSAQAEGFVNDIDIINGGGKSATKHFSELWDSTIKKPADRALYGWAANPWVWVIAFEQYKKQEENT